MNELTQKFENYIEENHKNGIFKSYIEIEEITNIEIHEVIKIIDNSKNFCRNTNGEWTTRDMYEKYTSFWNKFLDAGKIR